MDKPLVSIICICYNHRNFLNEAIRSVLDQTYDNTELIIIDDHSEDNSDELIREIANRHPGITYKLLDARKGICGAFNEGWKLSSGEFIIDLSADDILLPGRVEEGVNAFLSHNDACGINFTDAVYIDESGNYVRSHYKRNANGKLESAVPEGYIYPRLLERYFICTPTMMFKRSVLDYLNGYDENLAYEDFDFWVRTAKKFQYCFTDQVLVKKRIVRSGLSQSQYSRESNMLKSTLEVCRKAEDINENQEDCEAFLKRLRYEFRKALFSGNRVTGKGFLELMIRNSGSSPFKILYRILMSII